MVTTKQLAVMVIFAALYFVLNFIAPINIPTTVGTLQISFAALIATIFGIILGPYLGAGAALLGATVSWSLTGMSPYGLPFIFAPVLNALVSGFVFYRKWKWGFLAFAAMMIVFLLTPPVTPLSDNWYIALAVLFDKVITLALILPVALFGKKISVVHGAAFFFLLGFIGNQADNMWGSMVYALPGVYTNIFGFDLAAVRLQFLATPFLYPAIRLVEAIIVMVIAVPLWQTLKNTPWIWNRDNILSDERKLKKETDPDQLASAKA
ncbi:MAG TPA: ECF transporter S component [Candidatus Nanoarchaeia archaeon]|nr:ECF transporter S component [Candidatus Nanoarchaeia archaeon]